MVHQYKSHGFNIVLDVESGAVHIVDDVVYGNLNTSKLPWNDHSFDVVLFEREKVCKVRASQFVKTSGIIIDDREEERD